MIAARATVADIEAVVWRMRPESAVEAYASLPHDDPAVLANLLTAANARSTTIYALRDGATPVALVGLSHIAPGRARVMFLATARFPAIALAAHRWWRRVFMPLELGQLRRAEFTGALPDTPNGRWCRSVGFVCEGIARSHGKDGRDFAHWARVNPNWQRLTPPAGG